MRGCVILGPSGPGPDERTWKRLIKKRLMDTKSKVTPEGIVNLLEFGVRSTPRVAPPEGGGCGPPSPLIFNPLGTLRETQRATALRFPFLSSDQASQRDWA